MALSFSLSVRVGEKEVVHRAEGELAPASLTFLLGANGSGKSSLLLGLMGHPRFLAEGVLTLDGEDIFSCTPQEKSHRGLFLSQQHIPVVGGVTLTSFLHARDKVACVQEKPILDYYLALREQVRAYGLREDLLDRPLSQGLSGGERKISEMIQLVALRPHYALLDETDAGLDVDAFKIVCRTLARLSEEGMGILFATHHRTALDLLTPSAVWLMRDGALIEKGDAPLAERVLREGFGGKN
jgi:Fe-S cluster assembly ATP-binding protein